MSNEKISELPPGSPAQPGDAIPIARGGSNFSIAVSDISGGGGTGGGINVSLGGNTAGVLSNVSTGTLFLAGGNNVTLSQNGNSVTISANTAAAANLSISAGTTSGQFGGITLGNANNVSFGLNNGTITATASQSVQTGGIYLFGNTTGQSSSSTYDARSLSISASGLGSVGLSNGSLILSAPAFQFVGVGISTGGNTAGITGLQSQQVILVGGNNVTLSGSAAGGSGTVTINVPTQTVQTLGLYGSSQTYGQSSSSTYDARSLTLVGQGNVLIGQSGASIFISGASNSGASGSILAAGNTTGQSSASGYALTNLNVSLAGILSGGWSSNSFIISAPASTGISQSMFAVSNTTVSTSGTQAIGNLYLLGAGNVSVGVSNGSYVISGAGGGGGGVNFGVSTGGNTAGATGTVSTGNVVLVGSGPISLSQATGAAGSAATITINAPATSSISGTGQLSVAIAGSTISLGVPIETIFATGNTTQGSSGTFTAGSFLVNALGGVSAGYSNGSLVLSGAVGGGAAQSIGVSTGGNTSGNTGTYSGQVVFVGSNNITLSVSSGAAGAQTITIMDNTAAGVTTGGFYATGNTTQNSSSTLALSSQLFNFLGAMTGGFSNGSIQVSAPATSSISVSGNLSISTNGSTISLGGIGAGTGTAITGKAAITLGTGGISFNGTSLAGTGTSIGSTTGSMSMALNSTGLTIAQPTMTRWQVNAIDQLQPISAPGNASASFVYVPVFTPVTGTRIDALMSLSAGSAATTATGALVFSAYAAIYSRNGSTLSSLSSGSTQTTYTYASNTGGATGIIGAAMRPMSVPVNFNMPPGEYIVGFNMITNTSSIGLSTTNYGLTLSMMGATGVQTAQNYAEITAATANSSGLYYGAGVYSAATTGLPAAVSISGINQTGAAAAQANIALVFRNA